jgi:hypothetical protein
MPMLQRFSFFEFRTIEPHMDVPPPDPNQLDGFLVV